MVEIPRLLTSRRNATPRAGAVTFRAFGSQLPFVRIRVAVGAVGKGKRRPLFFRMTSVTGDFSVLAGERIAGSFVVIESQA